MITIVVISIITAIAYPSYRDNVRQTIAQKQRGHCWKVLSLWNACSQNNGYDKAASASLPSHGDTGKFDQHLCEISDFHQGSDATSYTLQAIAKERTTADYCKTR